MSERNKNLTAAAVIVLGAVFMAIGVMRGEADTVLQKAINTCLECIGLA